MKREQRIQEALANQFQADLMLVENESSQHNVPDGSETHFKVTIVTSHFEPLSRIARHRLVNSCLTNEFNTGLHALSLHLYTPSEWEKRGEMVQKSPNCKGGSRHG